jgi:hypothetical protein
MNTNEIATKADIERVIQSLKEVILSMKKEMSKTPKYLRSSEVREMLGIGDSKLQSMRINGLPYRKVDGICFYKPEDVVAYIEKFKVENRLEE